MTAVTRDTLVSTDPERPAEPVAEVAVAASPAEAAEEAARPTGRDRDDRGRA